MAIEIPSHISPDGHEDAEQLLVPPLGKRGDHKRGICLI
jgi:hypothetical protein